MKVKKKHNLIFSGIYWGGPPSPPPSPVICIRPCVRVCVSVCSSCVKWTRCIYKPMTENRPRNPNPSSVFTHISAFKPRLPPSESPPRLRRTESGYILGFVGLLLSVLQGWVWNQMFPVICSPCDIISQQASVDSRQHSFTQTTANKQQHQTTTAVVCYNKIRYKSYKKQVKLCGTL